MVDHGFLFNGPHWDFVDSPVQGLYFRTLVYEHVRGFEDFEPWLDRIVNFPEEVVDDALKSLPRQWMDGDDDKLEELMEKLLRRRPRTPELLQSCARGRVKAFPNWRL
jgi:hypothetical protein